MRSQRVYLLIKETGFAHLGQVEQEGVHQPAVVAVVDGGDRTGGHLTGAMQTLSQRMVVY